MKLNPAEYIIYTFGGVRATARELGRDPSSVCKWQVKNGGNGCIPSNLHKKVLKIAAKKKLDIRPDDLILGRVI